MEMWEGVLSPAVESAGGVARRLRFFFRRFELSWRCNFSVFYILNTRPIDVLVGSSVDPGRPSGHLGGFLAYVALKDQTYPHEHDRNP